MSKEINLLPLPRRRWLARTYFEREARHFGVSMLLGIFVVTAAGVGALVTLTVLTPVLFPSARGELETAVVDLRSETRAIQERNSLIAEMQRRGEERLTWSGYLPDIFASLPTGTQLAAVSADRTNRTITLQGRAAARSALIVFENKLKALLWVKEVVSPPANLLERVSPDFSLTVAL